MTRLTPTTQARVAFTSIPGKIGALTMLVSYIQRGILAGAKIDVTALRDDANTLRQLADILDKCATASAALPR